MSPENLYVRPYNGERLCRACVLARSARYSSTHKEERARYEQTPKMRATRRRYDASPQRKEAHRIRQAAYNATFRGWEVKQRSRLKGQREAIQAKLESLKKEEGEACRKLAALLIATK
jgi:hypothetical protein